MRENSEREDKEGRVGGGNEKQGRTLEKRVNV